MKSNKELLDPFKIVAKALGCSSESLSTDSAMYRDHGWDSFGQVNVITALEDAYGIRIDDEAIEKYVTMRAIQQLYEQILRGGDRSGG
ncbi:MAG: acyl carrier protein [Acidobacteria bacterium]|nr:acyl carrier protein [Acidobacteriota bacterium]